MGDNTRKVEAVGTAKNVEQRPENVTGKARFVNEWEGNTAQKKRIV